MLISRCPNCFVYLTGGESYCGCCGYDINEAPKTQFALPPSTLLNNRYIVGRVLGAGGFGITYLSFDTITNKVVAIKEYFPGEICTRSADKSVQPYRLVSAYNEGMHKFHNEAQLINSLQSCPWVVSVMAFFYENNTSYLVMEYIDGTTLSKIVKQSGGKIDFMSAKNMIVNIALGLSQLHRMNVLHRDISPDNIMVKGDGEVKLIDFGASRDYVNNQENGLSVILKPGYAPPEQYSKKSIQGPYTDVYALACTFYRIVTGVKVPESLARLSGTPMRSMKELLPYVPQYVSDGVDRALITDYKRRTQSMDDFIAALIEDPTVYEASNSKNIINTSFKEPQSKKVAKLTLYYGTSKIALHKLQSGIVYIAGRSPTLSNIVVKNDPLISRSHCSIKYNAQTRSVLITDTSVNGTFLIEYNAYLQKDTVYEFKNNITLQLASSDIFMKIQV